VEKDAVTQLAKTTQKNDIALTMVCIFLVLLKLLFCAKEGTLQYTVAMISRYLDRQITIYLSLKIGLDYISIASTADKD